MVQNAVLHQAYPIQALEVCLSMLLTLQEARPQILDMQRLVDGWTKLLLDYTTTEVCQVLCATLRAQTTN